MSVYSGHSGHSTQNSEYIDMKLEKQKLHRLKKSLDRQQQHLNDDREEFAFQIQQYKVQKNKSEILKQTIQKLKSEVFKIKKEKHEIIASYQNALQEIQVLKQKELSFKMSQTNYMKKIRQCKKETLNMKKRLKLALTDMDKQSKYYEHQIRKTEVHKNFEPKTISLINETSKQIEMEWNKCHGLLVNVKYKPSKVPSIRKSITSPIGRYDFDNMLSPSSCSTTPSPSSSGSHRVANSPSEVYQLYAHAMKAKEKQKFKKKHKAIVSHPKLIK